MNKKEAYFGGTELLKNSKGGEYLNINCYNDGELSVSDAEIVENEDSPEVVLIEHEDSLGERKDILIHKKDLLPLATFLLNIHNEYADRHNKIDFEYFSENIGV